MPVFFFFFNILFTDFEFAIKCGGPQITSSNEILYERDNETLGPATYYVVDTERWAVSNVGYFRRRKEISEMGLRQRGGDFLAAAAA